MPKSKISTVKSSKKSLRPRGVNGRFLKIDQAAVTFEVEAPVVETDVAPAIEAQVAQAPVAEAPKSREIPHVGHDKLTLSREGYLQLPPREYKGTLRIGFEVVEIRQAIDVMSAIKTDLQTALAVITLDGYKPWHLPLLKAIKEANDFAGHTRVLQWMWEHKGWSYEELYQAFPNPREGVFTTVETRYKARNLVSLLDGIRKASLSARTQKGPKQVNPKTPQKVIDCLCEEAYYLGWFE
jgi:hypothetical protein